MGQLTTKLQARRLIAFGWLALSIAMFYSTKRIDLQISLSAATWLRIAQGWRSLLFKRPQSAQE